MSALFFTSVVVIVVVVVVLLLLLLLLLSMLTLNKETKLDRLKIILKALYCFKHTGCGGGLTVGTLPEHGSNVL